MWQARFTGLCRGPTTKQHPSPLSNSPFCGPADRDLAATRLPKREHDSCFRVKRLLAKKPQTDEKENCSFFLFSFKSQVKKKILLSIPQAVQPHIWVSQPPGFQAEMHQHVGDYTHEINRLSLDTQLPPGRSGVTPSTAARRDTAPVWRGAAPWGMDMDHFQESH